MSTKEKKVENLGLMSAFPFIRSGNKSALPGMSGHFAGSFGRCCWAPLTIKHIVFPLSRCAFELMAKLVVYFPAHWQYCLSDFLATSGLDFPCQSQEVLTLQSHYSSICAAVLAWAVIWLLCVPP